MREREWCECLCVCVSFVVHETACQCYREAKMLKYKTEELEKKPFFSFSACVHVLYTSDFSKYKLYEFIAFT